MNTNTNSHINPHFAGLLAVISGSVPRATAASEPRRPAVTDEMGGRASSQWWSAAFEANREGQPFNYREVFA